MDEIVSGAAWLLVFKASSARSLKMSWELYFEKQKGRPVRSLYIKAIGLIERDETSASTAIDLGCGAGNETIDLLRRGWNVIAIDGEPASIAAVRNFDSPTFDRKLQTLLCRFENLTEIPGAEFVYSYHALPFCEVDHFDRVWRLIREAVKPNGIFAGSFFGLNDDWVQSGHTVGIGKEKLLSDLSGFDIVHCEEIDETSATALNGPKRWHYFEVIARKKG